MRCYVSTTEEFLSLISVKIGDCIICEAIAEIMYRIMANPNVDHSINHVLEKACRALPSRDQEKV